MFEVQTSEASYLDHIKSRQAQEISRKCSKHEQRVKTKIRMKPYLVVIIGIRLLTRKIEHERCVVGQRKKQSTLSTMICMYSKVRFKCMEQKRHIQHITGEE